jgi:hypothetical protein
MKAFTSIAGDSWLQGRRLLPLLRRHGAGVRGICVDLGCGSSPLQPLFDSAERYVRLDRYAFDPDVETITNPACLPLALGSVEVVLVSRVLGDIPDLVDVLVELHRVLVPGGRILVYESISYPQHDLPHDYWRVLPEGLKWAADKAGLVVSEVELLGGYFTQLALHWNTYIVGDLGGHALTRPLAWLLRAAGNMVFCMLDAAMPRPTLATDYFAVVEKPLSSGVQS